MRLQEARRQAAQAAVAQTGVDLAIHHVVQADAEAGQHLAAEFLQTQVGQVVAQQAPHQEFHREVIEPLAVLVAIARLGLQHAVHDAVANGQRHRLKVVGRLQLRHRANQGVANVPQDGLAQDLGGRHLRKKFRG